MLYNVSVFLICKNSFFYCLKIHRVLVRLGVDWGGLGWTGVDWGGLGWTGGGLSVDWGWTVLVLLGMDWGWTGGGLFWYDWGGLRE
jgi:hypothetical protein